MKVLIVGRGVVGTIYGWALSNAGIDITHVVRRAGAHATDALDLLDLRAGYPKHTRATYSPKTFAQIADADAFDLVIVATKHYQAADAVRQYLPHTPRATILLFTANWDGTGDIDPILPRSSALWGYAKATGGVDPRGTLVATVDPAVRLGMLEGSDPERFKAVAELFRRAGFTLDVKPNIVEWLWVHHAINAGGIGVCLWAGGIGKAARSLSTLRLGVRAVREALAVVADRGVNLDNYPEARSALTTPPWLASLAMAGSIRLTEKGRRLLSASHFDNSAEEMKRFYFDVLNTGQSRGVSMPHLSALQEKVASYPANQHTG